MAKSSGYGPQINARRQRSNPSIRRGPTRSGGPAPSSLSLIAYNVKAYNVAAFCYGPGLAPQGEGENPDRSKRVRPASTGPKPQIVLRDALNNTAEITKGADTCLIYNRSISEAGLTWAQLVDWWSGQISQKNNQDTARHLWAPARITR